jgi:hypothetical protein
MKTLQVVPLGAQVHPTAGGASPSASPGISSLSEIVHNLAPRLNKRESIFKLKTRRIMRSLPVEVLSMVLTFYALFAGDCLQADPGSMGADFGIDIVKW